MKVSVIIPTFNAENYIMATLKSAGSQTVKDIEILVVDDCSTDGTRAVVRQAIELDPRIRLVELEKNTGGPATPRNVGISEAKGEWIAFLDADDLWSSEKLKVQLTVAEEIDADFVCSKTVDFKGEKDTYSVQSNPTTAYSGISFLSLILKNSIPTSSVIVRRAKLTGSSFNQEQRFVAVEDYLLWMKLAQSKIKMIKLSSPLVGYRILPGSISRGKLKQSKKVWSVLTKVISERNPVLLVVMPLLFLSYVSQSIYFRLIKKAM